MNFHVAFTRGAVIMPTTITSQTRMALPEFQANQAGDIVVDVDLVRPWGLAEPEDQQAPPDRDEEGQPAWVAELTSSANNRKDRALSQTPESWHDYKKQCYLEPPQVPGDGTASSSSDNQAFMMMHAQAPTGLRLEGPPPGLVPVPESDSEGSSYDFQARDPEIKPDSECSSAPRLEIEAVFDTDIILSNTVL
jgi:hypothetical protein